MKTYYKINVAILLAFCLFACGEKNKKTIKKFMLEEKKCYKAYSSADINVAEKGLLTFRDIIHEYKSEGIESIEYNVALGYLYARLYLINHKKGLTQKARNYLNKSAEYFAKEKEFTNSETDEGKIKIIELINRLDSRFDIKWKKNF